MGWQTQVCQEIFVEKRWKNNVTPDTLRGILQKGVSPASISCGLVRRRNNATNSLAHDVGGTRSKNTDRSLLVQFTHWVLSRMRLYSHRPSWWP